MQGLQICYSVGIYFQSGTPVPELSNSPSRLPRSVSVLDKTISKYRLDINVNTNLSGGTPGFSTARQPCFHKRPKEEQRTLFGHIRVKFILTEPLPSINDDTSVGEPDRPGTVRVTTANRRPMTPVEELHHVHFDSDYDILLTRETADLDRDARELLHDMAVKLGVAEGKDFSAQVGSILAYAFARALTGSGRPVTEQAWLGGMYAGAERVSEARYVEAFRGALEELQGRCLEYERTRRVCRERRGGDLEGEAERAVDGKL